MSFNRYVGDYKLNEEFDEKGRVRHETVYIGRPYRFAADEQTVLAGRRKLLLCCAAEAAAWIAAMIPNSDMMHCFYVSLPFAFCAVPLFLLILAAMQIPSGREGLMKPMERRHAERFANRIPQSGMFLLILSAGAAAGTAAVWGQLLAGRNGALSGKDIFTGGNLFFSAMAVIAVLLAVLIFRTRTVFSVHEAS